MTDWGAIGAGMGISQVLGRLARTNPIARATVAAGKRARTRARCIEVFMGGTRWPPGRAGKVLHVILTGAPAAPRMAERAQNCGGAPRFSEVFMT